MSERDLTLYILDILIAIDKIKRYTKKILSPFELLSNELEWDATIRELQIIGDATNKLIKYELIDNSYKRIVSFRNQITHAYFGIDEEIVWDIITKKLDQYYADLNDIILSQNICLRDAVKAAIEENSHNANVIDFLKKIAITTSPH